MKCGGSRRSGKGVFPSVLLSALREQRFGRMLLGVSGGADSLALLYACHAVRSELGADLFVAHYDHALRPNSSNDMLFVKKVAATLEVPFISERNQDAPPRSGSLEAFAREKRQEFFIRTARALRIDAVVLAHTQDDLIETVLMRILRGTGLSGLRGILPQRIIRGVTFIRPMLAVSRRDVEAYLKCLRVSWRNDPTNANTAFTRNKIRHGLVPYLKKSFGADGLHQLAALADTVGCDYEFLEKEAAAAMMSVCRMKGGRVHLDLTQWAKRPQALRRMVLRGAVEAVQGDTQALTLSHVKDMERLAGASFKKGDVALPHGVIVQKSGNILVFFLKSLS
ncbi:MAG: tRNA lysidine(34) synthetase TilS [Candidatus Omnitrophica bacterium]|nr:tRNA lysidine(34) synthetase TilS [Candidatus Omnitrophota bacterium]